MRYIIPIPPQSHVRSTSGDSILFRIPDVCQHEKGKKPCETYLKNFNANKYEKFVNKRGQTFLAYCPHTLSKGGRQRKKLLERYNEYKIKLKSYVEKIGLMSCLYHAGWSLYFYFPAPKRSNNHPIGGRAAMHGQLKTTRPDDDNLYKAFKDALFVKDEKISQISGLGKFWIDPNQIQDPKLKKGYIEVLINQPIYNPFNVNFIDIEREAKLRKKRKYKNGV